MKNKLMKIGVVGSVIAALCCFTPVLVVLLGALGMSYFIAYLDAILLPIFLVFLLCMAMALIKNPS